MRQNISHALNYLGVPQSQRTLLAHPLKKKQWPLPDLANKFYELH
jgi:hypothetical protein